MPGRLGLSLLLLLPGLACLPIFARCEQPVSTELFEKQVRPLLVEKCLRCHDESKARGGLRLTSRNSLLRGGDSGPAVVPGAADRSLLLAAVRQTGELRMPPHGRLTERQIVALAAWINEGAVWPDPGPLLQQSTPSSGQEQQTFWAFQPVREPSLPAVRCTSWPRSPLDNFILHALEESGMTPAPPADKRTFLRRVTFDLIGLPPTPPEMDAFLQDESPEAFAHVVDRLLASPRYGERWGRHWLDVARYADSNGFDENVALANAWRYRDYVIAAFNKDKPYDEFIVEQLAGDLLPSSGRSTIDYERLTATGFLALGPKLLAEPDRQKLVMDVVDEQIDVTSRALLGLTVACARCHDHKFDPVSTRDYYALAGIFKSTRTLTTAGTIARVLERPLGDAKRAERAVAHAKLVRAKRDECKRAKDESVQALLRQELDELQRTAPQEVPMVLAVRDAPNPANVRIHLRGDPQTLGEEAPRQFPHILGGEDQQPLITHQSGRLELARWIVSKDNPLTARVLVNRVWQHHFGEGLVRSPDNFGKLGEQPTHPELLDWLAVRFVESGWSIKALHRLILLSNTYRMSTACDARAAQFDPENRLHWRHERRRLEAEAIRDSLLSLGGDLDCTAGGGLLTTANFVAISDPAQEGRGSKRRSVYLPVVRNAVCDALQVFDFAEPSVLNGKRDTTTVAPQALFLLNSPLARAEAKSFATRLLARSDLDDAARVRRAYLEAYARLAEPDEVATALDYLDRFGAQAGNRRGAWESFCQALMAASEFVYVN